MPKDKVYCPICGGVGKMFGCAANCYKCEGRGWIEVSLSWSQREGLGLILKKPKKKIDSKMIK